jgi:hypothetical protein
VTATTACPAPRVQSTVLTGTAGEGGWAFIVNDDEAGDMQPNWFATVYVNVPEGTPVSVVVEPVPNDVTASGFLVNVHVPEAGKPLNDTLPVATEQVGCTSDPITGAVGEADTVTEVAVVNNEQPPFAAIE